MSFLFYSFIRKKAVNPQIKFGTVSDRGKPPKRFHIWVTREEDDREIIYDLTIKEKGNHFEMFKKGLLYNGAHYDKEVLDDIERYKKIIAKK